MTARATSANALAQPGSPAAERRSSTRTQGLSHDPFAVMGRVVARRRAAKARRESQVSREEWTRLRRETIGSIDHELRTPLTSVIGYTELVLAGDAGPLTEEQTWMLERVAGNAGTLLGLLEELLTAAGECVTEARAVDVVELVDQVIGDPEAAPRTPPPAYALRGHNTGS